MYVTTLILSRIYSVDVVVAASSVALLAAATTLWWMTRERVCSLLVRVPVAPIRDRGLTPFPRRGHDYRASGSDGMCVYSGPELRFDVTLTFPLRVYEGDSHNINLDFQPNVSSPDMTRRIRQHPDAPQTDGALVWMLPADPGVKQFVQATLVAAGFNIDGDKVQRQEYTPDAFSFNWSCYFPNSGTHAFGLHTHISCLDDIRKVGSLERTIQVVRIWCLTKRQVWVIKQCAAALGAIAAVCMTLHKVGLW
jgi:hypothetical protein